MTTPLPHQDLVAGAAARLEAAQDATDQERLRVLDELYAGLEAELERDIEQAGPAGR
ncbi:MAG: hypothetical protein M3279_07830 [Actinomycetota bacterium]|nr:hypothetical protein [Actinomycetota bacterium]